MGSITWCIFSLTLFSFASHDTIALQHATTLKSFDELRLECLQYLPPSEASYNVEDCSDRCFWNDTNGRSSNSIARFYRPDSCDQDYINRTLQCMCETVQTLPRNASCQRASCAMQCYHDQFGQLINREPLYVPFNKFLGLRIVGQCAQMLQISGVRLDQIMVEGFDKTPEGRCLMRCFLIRAGLYSDCGGPDIERFSVQCEGYGPEYKQLVTNCYEELKSQQLDSCTLATRMLYECVQANEYSTSNILSVFEPSSDILAVFEPYLEGTISITDFARLNIMVALDNLIVYYPSLARN
nr:general odorant-binding protein 45 [Aedes albopictus]